MCIGSWSLHGLVEDDDINAVVQMPAANAELEATKGLKAGTKESPVTVEE